MAGDFIREVRAETLPTLSADPTIIYTEGATVYPEVVDKPKWPFLRWGEPASSPLESACLNGARVTFTIHVFCRAREEDGRITQTAEDYCSNITAQVKHVLHKRGWQTTWGRIKYRVTSSRLIRDAADNRAYHGVVQFEARAIAEPEAD